MTKTRIQSPRRMGHVSARVPHYYLSVCLLECNLIFSLVTTASVTVHVLKRTSFENLYMVAYSLWRIVCVVDHVAYMRVVIREGFALRCERTLTVLILICMILHESSRFAATIRVWLVFLSCFLGLDLLTDENKSPRPSRNAIKHVCYVWSSMIAMVLLTQMACFEKKIFL
jgi:hypothetical protein